MVRKGGKEGANLIASFLFVPSFVVRVLGSPAKVSGPKLWRLLQLKLSSYTPRRRLRGEEV
jgi:hypothetical protein